MSRNGKGSFRKAIAKAAADAPPKPTRVARMRLLSDEEIDLWLSVAAGITPRPDASMPSRVAMSIPVTSPVPALSPMLAAPMPSPKVKSALPPLAPLDRKLKQRLSRGRMTADAAIDLHGYRQAEAFSALRHFLHRAQGEGARVVLVVTGKGGRPGYVTGAQGQAIGVGEGGVLKRSVPLWLALPEFRMMVIGYEEAAQPHGGSGALYVTLRRGERPER